MAIMFVPMVIVASAAVDFARIASARALLQASVDSAAVAGVGAYQTSQSHTTATTVALDIYNGTGVQLTKFVTTTTPNTGAYCSTTDTTEFPCDAGSASSGGLSADCPPGWNTNQNEYCMVVQETATIKNSLFAWLIPSEALSVTGVAATPYPQNNIGAGSFPPSPGFGSAGDISRIYAYGVPQDSAGADEFTTLPSGAGCGNLPGATLLPGYDGTTSSECQYLFVAASNEQQATPLGSFALGADQPIAFLFVNDTGANSYTDTSGPTAITQLMVSANSNGSGAVYNPNGESFTITNNNNTTTYVTYQIVTTTVVCSSWKNNGTCNRGDSTTTATTTTETTLTPVTTGTVTTCNQTAGRNSNICENQTTVVTTATTAELYGQCPADTLYGSQSPGSGAPQSDQVNIYSSAYEVLGYPPTQNTNHVLTPFLSSTIVTNEVNGKNYYVQAVCPNYPISGTAIRAPIETGYTNSSTGISSTMTVSSDSPPINIFSTWFPAVDMINNPSQDVVYSDSANSPSFDEQTPAQQLTTGSKDIFPPGIAGCTAAYNAYDGGITPAADDPWWNWGSSNYGQCTNTTTPQYVTGTSTQYLDCALLIQPLGIDVPTITATVDGTSENEAVVPDWWVLIEDANHNIIGMDPVWDDSANNNLAYFQDEYPGVFAAIATYTGDTTTSHNIEPQIALDSAGNVYDYDRFYSDYNSQTKTTTISGWTPSNNLGGTFTIPYSGTVNGKTAKYIVVEEPASDTDNQTLSGSYPYEVVDHNPPYETSHKCYNSVANGNAAGSGTLGEEPTSFTDTQDNNTTIATPIDEVANPEDGAIICNEKSTPQTYELFWNDLGTYDDDDLGYWNAVVTFTCSVPQSSRTGGPAALTE